MRALIRTPRVADRLPMTGSDIDNLNSHIGVVRVTENSLARGVGRNMPRIEANNFLNLASFQIEAFQRDWPNCKDQIPRGAKKSFVHDELVVAVFIETLHFSCFPVQQMHPRRRVIGELNDSIIKWMELRVNDRPWPAKHDSLVPSIRSNHGDSRFTLLFDGRYQPFSTVAQVALAQLRI